MHGWMTGKRAWKFKLLAEDWWWAALLILVAGAAGIYTINTVLHSMNAISDTTPLSQLKWGDVKWMVEVVVFCSLYHLVK